MSAPAKVTCWTGKNGGGGSTLRCRTTRTSRSGPPGRARPPRPRPRRCRRRAADVYDPERIKAALRGGRTRTEHGGRRTSDPGVLAPASTPSGTGLGSPDPGLSVEPGTGGDGWGAAAASAGWDPAPDPGVTAANGNHSATVGNRGPFDAAFTSLPEAAEPAPAEEFSWLQRSEPESQPSGGDGDLTWPGQTANGGSAEPADRSHGWSGHTESVRPGHEDPDVTERSCGIRPKGWRPGKTRTSGASRSRRLRPICAYRPRRREPRSPRSRGPRGRPPPTPLARSRSPRTGRPPSRPIRRAPSR